MKIESPHPYFSSHLIRELLKKDDEVYTAPEVHAILRDKGVEISPHSVQEMINRISSYKIRMGKINVYGSRKAIAKFSKFHNIEVAK